MLKIARVVSHVGPYAVFSWQSSEIIYILLWKVSNLLRHLYVAVVLMPPPETGFVKRDLIQV